MLRIFLLQYGILTDFLGDNFNVEKDPMLDQKIQKG